MKVAEIMFKKPPAFPYIVFMESIDTYGADLKNNIASRSIGIELYAEKIDHTSEALIEGLLNEKAIKYKRDRTWIETEEFFQTVYDFNLIEKE